MVPAASPFQTAADFVAALKADPGQGAGSRRLGRRLRPHPVRPDRQDGRRRPATSLSYVPFAGGGEALAALLGNQVAAGISGYGEFAEQVKAGALRLLAISADKRQEGIDAPTLKEAGIDVELFNWRGVFAPPGVSDADKAAMVALVEKMAEQRRLGRGVQEAQLDADPAHRRRLREFLTEDTARIEAILKDLGLA